MAPAFVDGTQQEHHHNDVEVADVDDHLAVVPATDDDLDGFDLDEIPVLARIMHEE